jgi:hypothetical protein
MLVSLGSLCHLSIVVEAKFSLGRKSPYCTALWIQNKMDELARGNLPYRTKGAGTLLTIFKLNRHGSLGRHPHLLLKTSKGFMPNDDGMLGWGKRGYEAAMEDVLPQKDVLSTKRESRDLPAFPEYQAKGEKTYDKKTPNS